jgi:hypothetical protein
VTPFGHRLEQADLAVVHTVAQRAGGHEAADSVLGLHHADPGQVGEGAPDREPADPVALSQGRLRGQRVPRRQAAVFYPAEQVGPELLPDGRPGRPLNRAEQPERGP